MCCVGILNYLINSMFHSNILNEDKHTKQYTTVLRMLCVRNTLVSIVGVKRNGRPC